MIATEPRRAEAQDLPAIRALLTAESLPLAGLDDADTQRWVLEEDGVVSACAALERYGDIALLRSVATRPDRRGRGLAQRLCRAVLDAAGAAGVRDVYLLTTSAERYFGRLGFRTIPRERADERLARSAEWGECCRSAVLMTRSLAP